MISHRSSSEKGESTDMWHSESYAAAGLIGDAVNFHGAL